MTAHQRPRCGSIRVVQELAGNCFDQTFKLVWCPQAEVAKEYGPLALQTFIEEAAVFSSPRNQVKIRIDGPDNERQLTCGCQIVGADCSHARGGDHGLRGPQMSQAVQLSLSALPLFLRSPP